MMGSALTNLLAFIVAISVLVAVHEYGHYIVGRWCGMKVLRFSIGFGKPIWMRVGGKDRTEYCISAIPLGGYVKFLGERYGTGDPVDPADRGRAFNDRPVWNRILVLLAGPFFNFLFAFFAYWVLFINGVPTMKPAVGVVEPESYAAEAGLRHGDRIVKVGEREAGDWETALVTMLDEMVSNGAVTLTLEEPDGFTRTATLEVGADATRLTEPGMLFDGLGFQPWQPPADIATVEDDGAAARAGVLPGVPGAGDETGGAIHYFTVVPTHDVLHPSRVVISVEVPGSKRVRGRRPRSPFGEFVLRQCPADQGRFGDLAVEAMLRTGAGRSVRYAFRRD